MFVKHLHNAIALKVPQTWHGGHCPVVCRASRFNDRLLMPVSPRGGNQQSPPVAELARDDRPSAIVTGRQGVGDCNKTLYVGKVKPEKVSVEWIKSGG
jgi:hypothetical protein